MSGALLFRQLLDPETSTWTYLVADRGARKALLIDPVLEQVERDAALLFELGLELACTLETHVHADHITSSGQLRERLGSRVCAGAASGVENADRLLADGERLAVGDFELETRATPGHTDGCVSYVVHAHGLAFTGDALLIRGCGRTDFQQGDPATLFHSVRERLFSLPDDTLLYPGHDYKGRTVTSVVEEKRFNPRLGMQRTLEEFTRIMAGLGLPEPKRMHEAVPANLVSGVGGKPDADAGLVAEAMERQGRQDAEIWQGADI